MNKGEKTVIRVLDTKSVSLNLEDLGFAEDLLHDFQECIRDPNGIILATGPTGSGKSTTLYAALNAISSMENNVCTVEDPIEYHLPLINQFQVQEKIGLTFSRALRTLLRQDPDVIMVGEIRDDETARTAIQAALTGHLVFSTLHTNDACSAITRMINMGVEPYLIGAALNAVLAQRLLRRLCKNCRKAYSPTQEEFDDIVNDYGEEDFKKTGIKFSSDLKLYSPVGCEQCNGTGYKGRLGIHELMNGTPTIKRMIKKQASAEELFVQAKEEEMTTLMQDGILKVFNGLSDMNEVRRVCIS